MVLDRIKKVNDIKQLNEEELAELQEEIRDFLVENIAKTGGHLASNLGVIELTMALHLSFDLTRDRIIWDVGHQSYTHKILTGRKLGFATLRQYERIPKDTGRSGGCIQYRAQLHVHFRRTWHGAGEGTDR